jgi:hypothetical protein
MSEGAAQREMPRYRCHKQVWALKIKAIIRAEDGSAMLQPDEAGYAPLWVSAEYMKKYDPLPGGYYVVYVGGYTSFSPASEFESGYSKI